MKKIIVLTFVLIVAVSGISFAEESNVQIQKKEERTEAVVTTDEFESGQPDNKIDQSFNLLEKGVMGVVEPLSYWSGKAVDYLVIGFEKTGNFLFSKPIYWMDFKNRF